MSEIIKLYDDGRLQIGKEGKVYRVEFGEPEHIATERGSLLHKSVNFIDPKMRAKGNGSWFLLPPRTPIEATLITEEVMVRYCVMNGKCSILLARPGQKKFENHILDADDENSLAVEYGKGTVAACVPFQLPVKVFRLSHPPYRENMQLKVTEDQEIVKGMKIPREFWREYHRLLD